jgi:hypothetical protein
MKPNRHEPRIIDEAERQRREAERRFEELMKRPSPKIRPRLMGLEVSRQMAMAIERNPASLKMFANDPETGVTVAERPYAATGGSAVLVRGEDFDVYAVVRR